MNCWRANYQSVLNKILFKNGNGNVVKDMEKMINAN